MYKLQAPRECSYKFSLWRSGEINLDRLSNGERTGGSKTRVPKVPLDHQLRLGLKRVGPVIEASINGNVIRRWVEADEVAEVTIRVFVEKRDSEALIKIRNFCLYELDHGFW